MVRSNRKVDRMKKWRKFLLAAALLLGIFCIWFFTGNTTIQGDAVDRLVVSSIPRMDLQKVTEDPEYHFNEIVTAFKTAASKMPRVDAIGVSSAGTFGRFWFRTRENGNVHRVFITGFHTITFDNRPYYTPVDLSQWFPELYHSLEDVPEEPFSYPN